MDNFFSILTDANIRKLAMNDNVFLRGIQLYNHKRVRYVKFNPLEWTFEAVVEGDTDTYNVLVRWKIIKNERFNDIRFVGISHFCECKATKQYKGFCKHAIAVLKAVSRGEFEITDSHSDISKKIAKSIEKEQLERERQLRRELYLQIAEQFNELVKAYSVVRIPKKEPNIYLRKIISLYYTNTISVEFKVGSFDIGKEYVLKNITRFLNSYTSCSPFEFGKRFIYDPAVDTFAPEDEELISFMIDLQKVNYELVSNDKILVPLALWDRFFGILKGKHVEFSKFSNNIEILPNEDIEDIEFKFEKDNDKFVINCINIDKVYPLSSDFRFVIYNGRKLLKLPSQKGAAIKPLYNLFPPDNLSFDKEHKIVLNFEDGLEFMKNYFSFIKKGWKVSVSPELESKIKVSDLKVKVYFDSAEGGILAKIKYCYGEDDLVTEDDYVTRDWTKEAQIENHFLTFGFEQIEDDTYFLDDEDSIYSYVLNGLPFLLENAEVYYSEKFKSFRVRDSVKFKTQVRMNGSSIEFWLGFDDINSEELPDIFEAYSLKKKYHRLKDGSILLLDNEELKKAYEIAQKLEISNKDLKKGQKVLSKFKSLYLNELLENSNIESKKSEEFAQLVERFRNIKEAEVNIPQNLQNVLREYQKFSVMWLSHLYQNGFGGILADDMGLGKTLQVLAFIEANKDKLLESCLIVAPTSLIYNWEQEIKRFTPSLRAIVIDGTPKKRNEMIERVKDFDIVITSYPLLKRDIELYKDIHFSVCIIDEAQHIKNPLSLSAEVVKSIKASCCFALTGTPLENSLAELWSIFDFVLPGYLGSYNRFSERFEKPIVKNNDSSVLEDLRKMISPFVLRRLKSEVLNELPEKIETQIMVEMTQEQEKVYKLYLTRAKKEIEDEINKNGFEKSQIKIFSILTRLRQICSHPSLFIEDYNDSSGKLELLEEILSDSIEAGHRAIIFSQWTEMLSIIKERVTRMSLDYFYLDGSTKAEDRMEMINRFNSGEKKLFLISLKAGGFGLNLTGADVVIHYDLWWNPAVEDQATDRAYRIGQDKAVQVFKLITRGTIEEKIYELQQKKKHLFDSVITPNQTFLSKLTQEEIMEILE